MSDMDFKNKVTGKLNENKEKERERFDKCKRMIRRSLTKIERNGSDQNQASTSG